MILRRVSTHRPLDLQSLQTVGRDTDLHRVKDEAYLTATIEEGGASC